MSPAAPRAESLRGLLDPSRVVVPLRPREFRAAVGRLGEPVASAPGVRDPAGVREVLAELEPAALVPLGEHVLLAHVRTESVDRVTAALGISREPFPFAPGTGSGARVLLLILAPADGTRSYLQTLGGFGRVLRRTELGRRLAEAASPEEALALPELETPVRSEELRVGDVMTPDVVSVGPDLSLAEIAGVLVERRLRALPVVNEAGEVLGMVTDRQVMQHFLPRLGGPEEAGVGAGRGARTPVREVMSRTVMCVTEDQGVGDVAALMINKDVERFPVVSEGRLVGFLTRGDIIRRLLSGVEEDARGAPPGGTGPAGGTEKGERASRTGKAWR